MARIASLPLYRAVDRLDHASARLARPTAVGAVLYLLAGVGFVVLRGIAQAERGLAGWAERRRQREEDRQLWELALSDPRVMADLIAVQQHADGAR